MKQTVLVLTLLIAVLMQMPLIAADDAAIAEKQHAAIQVKKDITGVDFYRNTHPDAQWFPKAGLGLMICWGPSAVAGNSEISWSMMRDFYNPTNFGTLTPEDYFDLAKRFTPQKYDPDKWLKAAKAAGFQYAVLITKHHDGYALWPSNYGDYSTKQYLNGRDLVKPFVDACRRNGLKVGLYYSPPDWYYNRNYMSFRWGSDGTKGNEHLGLRHEVMDKVPEKPAGFDEQCGAYVRGQIEELLTQYGKVDYLWFDGSIPAGTIPTARIRELQPGIVINDRMHGAGDVTTAGYEWRLPLQRPEGWWEHCMTMTGKWGYTEDHYLWPASFFLATLVVCRTWDGNYLPNWGADADGEMPELKYYQTLRVIESWMEHSGKSIIGTVGGPFPEQSNVHVTTRGKTWYFHVLPLRYFEAAYKRNPQPDFAGTIVATNVRKPKKVRFVRTGQSLPFTYKDGRLSIPVPEELRTELVDVVEVQWR